MGSFILSWHVTQVINPLFFLLVPKEKLHHASPAENKSVLQKKTISICLNPNALYYKEHSSPPPFPLTVMHFFSQHAVFKNFDISLYLIIAFIVDHANLSVLISLKTYICQHKPFYFLYVDTKISHIDFCVAPISCKLSKQ